MEFNKIFDQTLDNKGQDNNKQSNMIEFSESDDYLDILTVKSNDSGSVHVKFKCQTNNEKDGGENGSTNVQKDEPDDDDNDDYPVKDCRRFLKSPHPRGSARFAVKPLNQEFNFIDSTVDAEKALAEQLQEENMVISIW